MLPKLSARLFLEIYESVWFAVNQGLPNLIQTHNTNQQNQTDASTKFYQRWPALNKPEYKPTLDRLAAMYRQLNPTVGLQQAIEEVGAQVSFALKLTPDLGAPAPAQAPVPAPHIPAQPGGVGIEAPPSEILDWAQLTEDFERED